MVRPARARAIGIRIENGKVISGHQRKGSGVNVCLSSGEGETIERIGCDAVAMSGG